jgi:quinol monooxygenase YgiN
MQRLTLVRYATKPDRADENEALARAVHAELRAMAPTGLAYLLFRNNTEFVHLFVNAREDNAEALTSLPAFKAYTANIQDRCEAPPEQTRLSVTLLESYGLSRE